ncbi:MAG: hypothetical protein JOZ73_14250, partial [Solirubrobacterales bacterium]|nr:hypothetical protein [Solirubrobacterales bacterium]
APELISNVRIDSEAVQVTRGSAPVEPRDFDVSACLDEAARRLLASEDKRRLFGRR